MYFWLGAGIVLWGFLVGYWQGRRHGYAKGQRERAIVPKRQ